MSSSYKNKRDRSGSQERNKDKNRHKGFQWKPNYNYSKGLMEEQSNQCFPPKKSSAFGEPPSLLFMNKSTIESSHPNVQKPTNTPQDQSIPQQPNISQQQQMCQKQQQKLSQLQQEISQVQQQLLQQNSQLPLQQSTLSPQKSSYPPSQTPLQPSLSPQQPTLPSIINSINLLQQQLQQQHSYLQNLTNTLAPPPSIHPSYPITNSIIPSIHQQSNDPSIHPFTNPSIHPQPTNPSIHSYPQFFTHFNAASHPLIPDFSKPPPSLNPLFFTNQLYNNNNKQMLNNNNNNNQIFNKNNNSDSRYNNRNGYNNTRQRFNKNTNWNNNNKWNKSNSNKQTKEDKRKEGDHYCESCDRSFKSELTLKEHTSQHIMCGKEGCKYMAHPKLVKLHIRNQHSRGMARVIWGVESKEEVERWRRERKRNYPTEANIERKRKEKEERFKRGEIVEEKKFGKMKNKNNFNNENDETNNNIKFKTCHGGISGNNANLEDGEIDDDDDDNDDDLVIDDKNDGDDAGNVCSNINEGNNGNKRGLNHIKKVVDNNDYFNLNGDDEEKDGGDDNDGKMAGDDNNSLPVEVKNKKLVSYDDDDESHDVEKDKSNHNKNKYDKYKNNNKNNNHKRRQMRDGGRFVKRASLLEKLLAGEVRRERNVVMQCVRFICHLNHKNNNKDLNKYKSNRNDGNNGQHGLENQCALTNNNHNKKYSFDNDNGYGNDPICDDTLVSYDDDVFDDYGYHDIVYDSELPPLF